MRLIDLRFFPLSRRGAARCDAPGRRAVRGAVVPRAARRYDAAMGIRKILFDRQSRLERGLLAAAGVMVLGALFLPIWEIYLQSQQYPEGIRMFIHARTLTGNLQSINILNHYIGMKPLSVEMFSEFTWLSPVLMLVGGALLVAAALGRRVFAWLAWLGLYVFDFGMLFDLFRWMNDWGHHLDPHAPMSIAPFTPPVLGFERVANFVIYSFPSWGGMLVVLASLFGLGAAWQAWRCSR